MENECPILFEEMSDFARLKMYVKMAVIAMRNGSELPKDIIGIFDPDVLDEIGELYSEINALRNKGG